MQYPNFRMLFVLFLVSGLLTAQGQGNPFRRQSDSEDWCASGSSVLKKFLTCGQETIDALQLFEVEVLNYEALLSILNVYCSQVMPATRECFAREISSCDTATQRHLNQLANNTSFLCQPGGNQTLTQMTFLLTEMAQGRVAMPEPCYDVPVWTCHADATAASHQGDEAMLQAASVDEIISLAQTYIDVLAECIVRVYRENADTCSGWRESAVWAIFRPFMPSYLGSTFPFTQNEVEEKFQL